MTLPVKTVLATSAFHHIGVMVFLMSFLLGIAGFGYLALAAMTQGWIDETRNIMSIEIPAYDSVSQTVLTPDQLKTHEESIREIIGDDPLVKAIEFHIPKTITIEGADIPAPVFLTLHLHPDRVENAEHRLINAIKSGLSSVIIRNGTLWETDIGDMALILKTAFAALALSVCVITVIVVIGVVHTQLRASLPTIHLVHLMGATASTIQGIFLRAMGKSIVSGSLCGIIGLIAIALPIADILGITGFLPLLWGVASLVFFIMLPLSLTVTGLTVATTLRDMP